ncbi:acetylornithine deacetylase [Propionibacteriaceae bacterium Y1700]|uniref:acetylornithine deacetylase n=1 Tax=Microlunatus sp. Y1700 TaxID=3418487 RepID=UPI003DA73B48
MSEHTMDWLRELVAIDTTSRNSNRALIDLVAQRLTALGLEPHVRPSQEQPKKANLVVTIPAADGSVTGGVVLSGHTDVVPVDGQDWSTDPWTVRIADGRAYGRGTADMKGFIASVLAAVPAMQAADLAEPIHLALSYDEEVGCVGGAQITKDLADLGLTPTRCLVGEPSSMRVIGGHKSINVVEVTFTGVAAHSSLTPQGVNAIEYAAELVRAVRTRAERWREEGPYDEAYLVPHTTASVNMITGGAAQNIVADTCRVTFEFRTIAADDPGETITWVRELADDLQQRMRAEQPGAAVSVDVIVGVPGLETAQASPARTLGTAVGGLASTDKVTYGTEAGLFAAAGIETVVCGPGDIAQAHTPDEFVELSQLDACDTFLAALITELSTPTTAAAATSESDHR